MLSRIEKNTDYSKLSNLSWRHIPFGQENYRSLSDLLNITIPLGAIETFVKLEAFRFPPDIISQCANSLLSGYVLQIEGDEARILEDWLEPFQSDISLPNVPFGENGPYGWEKRQFRVFQHLSLKCSINSQSESLVISLVLDSADDGNYGLNIYPYEEPIIPILPYVRDGELPEIGDQQNSFGNQEFHFSNFDVYPIVPQWLRETRDAERAGPYPLLLESQDIVLQESISDCTHVVGDDDIEDPRIRAILSGGSTTYQFHPAFTVPKQNDNPCTAGSFAEAIVSNMSGAPPDQKLDHLLLIQAKNACAELQAQLQRRASLIESYRDKLS